jgi:hypothetical protein
MTALQRVAPIRRSIVDVDPRVVAAQVDLVRRSGRLVAMSTPRQLADGRAHVVVTLLPASAPPARRRKVAGTAVCVVAAVAGTAALVAAVVWAVTWLADHLAQIAGAGVAALVLLFALTRVSHSGVCPGLHCSGCRG